MESTRSKASLFSHSSVWCASIVISALAAVHLGLGRTVRDILEGIILIGLLAGIGCLPVVRSCYRKMPRAHRVAGTLLIVLMVGGHLAGKDARTFPFVSWEMFSAEPAGRAVHHIETEGVSAEGTRILLNPERLFPSLGMGSTRMRAELEELTSKIVQAEPSKRELANQRLNDMLRAIGRAYQRKNGVARIERIEAIQVVTSLDGSPPLRTKVGEASLP